MFASQSTETVCVAGPFAFHGEDVMQDPRGNCLVLAPGYADERDPVPLGTERAVVCKCVRGRPERCCDSGEVCDCWRCRQALAEAKEYLRMTRR